MDADNRKKTDAASGTSGASPAGVGRAGEWTKERPGKQRPFDFDAFLDEESPEERRTNAPDDKDPADGAGASVQRAGERGRHEAPGSEPDPQPERPDEPPAVRFTRDDAGEADAELPPRSARSAAEPDARPKRPTAPVPPPRPKVVVAEPAPRVVVTPERRYPDVEPPRKGLGRSGKFLVALLITVAVVLALAVLAITLLPGGGKEPSAPAPSPTDYLFGGLATRPPSVPTAPPAPTQAPVTQDPGPTPPPLTYFSVAVTAGPGGSVSPNGMVDVQEGGSVTFTITPDPGYALAQLLIDGSAVSVTNSYTFSDVHQSHTLYAVFQQLSPTEPPATGAPVVTDPPVVTDDPGLPAPPPAVEG